MKNVKLTFALLMILMGKAFSQSQLPMPKIIEKNGHHTLLVDGKPYFMLGGQSHNSSAWAGMMPQLWLSAAKMNVNTLEVPIYWEQVEPQQGKFDFSSINMLLTQARAHKVRLVLLWFGTWKNGSNHYMPEWMKQNSAKYPNIIGDKGQFVDSPSPNVQATLDADKKAFATVMKYLKKTDPQHTVIMVQVENESGAWGSVRDFSAFAQKIFEGPVPAQLLRPELLKALNVPVVTEGTWAKVFGDRADEYFHAWYVARFIGQVAAAGKAEYPLPMYANCALRDPLTNPPAKSYESGGPTDNVIPIWKIAAPALDVLGPDIYLAGNEKVLKVIDLYDRPDNALFVPETSFGAANAKYLYTVIANGGIGYSPFGIDNATPNATGAEVAKHVAPFAAEYAMIAPMVKELAEWAAEGKVKAVIEREDHAEQTVDLGAWQAVITFGTGRRNTAQPNQQANGKIMMVQLSENKFIMMGTLAHITFKPSEKNAGHDWQYLKVEEGSYKNGSFNLLRVLNGDETDWGGPRFGATPTVLQISLVAR